MTSITTNGGKLLVILVLIVALSTFVLTGNAAFSDVLPIITLIVGFAVGNGQSAVKGEIVTPLISRNPVAVPEPVVTAIRDAVTATHSQTVDGSKGAT